MNAMNFENWITEDWRDELKKKQGQCDQKTASEIQMKLDCSTVVDRDSVMEGRVQFASFVTVFGIEEEEEQSFQIVSEDESLERAGCLNWKAPLAQALFGAKEGEIVRVLLPNGSNSDYEVTHIRTNAIQ